MPLKDFTKAEAAQWVRQELAKTTTPQQIKDRIESEEKFQKELEEVDLGQSFPISRLAHKELIIRLKAQL